MRRPACMVILLVIWLLALVAPAQAAPPGRAYEMVSPVDKNGGHIARDLSPGQFGHQTGAAESGEAVAFVSQVAFGDVEAGTLFFPNYLARRGSLGWATEGISPPMGGGAVGGTENPSVLGLSQDVSKAFVLTGAQLAPGAPALNGSWGLYMRSSGLDDRYGLVSIRQPDLVPDSADTSGAHQRFEYEGGTPDSRHVIFNSSRRLLPGAPLDGTQAGTPNALYEWVDGSLRLASTLPPGLSLGTLPQPRVGAGIGGARLAPGNLHGDHVISDDGRRIFFTVSSVEGPGGPLGALLFVREDGASTRVVSRPEGPGDPPLVETSAEFWAAKRTDGSVAFFTSTAPLTEGADSRSLYRWDANAGAGPALSALTEDPAGQPGLLGPAAVDDAATSVYFVATGELAPGATRGAPNLFVWREGQGVRHIATLAGTPSIFGIDSMMWRLAWKGAGGRAARVSADGERLLFASYAQLDPTYDTTEAAAEACGDPAASGDHCRQIYLYDARRDRISCLTCVSGVPVTGDANLFGNGDARRPGFGADAPLSLPRNLSADGTRAFFETGRRLVAEDRNSQIDVYEWQDANLDGAGELHLISSGQGVTDSEFLDASVSGSDVFFTSRDRLVGIDADNQVDLYDARVGGGIAAQNPPPAAPPCQGDICQGPSSGAPLLPGPSSGGTSHGDARPGARPRFSVKRLSRAQRARLARGRRVMVRVRVNRAGSVSLTARAKLGGRKRAVARAAKRARRAGSVKLSLKLSTAARRQLARKRKLGVTLAVRFAGVREAKTSTVRLSRARRAGERGSR